MSAAVERWAAALAAPIRARLSLPLTRLATAGKTFCKEQLEGVASISDRGDLLAQLPVYLDTGTRDEYARYQRWHRELPPEVRSTGFFLVDQLERLKRVFVHDHIGRPEEVSVAAWDVGRAVHYVALGWGAGYLDESEVWQAVAKAARIAVDAYDSWEAYGRGFRYGRWFWAGYWADGMAETEAAIAQLLGHGGAWHDLPWPGDLAAIEARGAQPSVAKAPTAWAWKAVRMFVDCPGCLTPVLVREVGDAVTCDACGERSEVAAKDAWTHGAAPDDEDDDDEEDDDAPEPGAVALSTNLDDHIQRALTATPDHAACACGAAITPAHVTAADGAHRCACGRATPVVAAPAWLRAIDANVRFVVGGPLALGRPDGMLYLLRAQEPA